LLFFKLFDANNSVEKLIFKFTDGHKKLKAKTDLKQTTLPTSIEPWYVLKTQSKKDFVSNILC
jgi:hypothetical protein